MSKGVNILESSSKNSSPTIFLSHKSEDKDYVEQIGLYLTNAGLNIYLDKYDSRLQSAVSNEDPNGITSCIHRGVNNSDYILCITSSETVKSWWVPYEIGYGRNAQKKIATLVRNGTPYIPDYLKIEKILESISDLNNFISDIYNNHNIILNESTSYTNYTCSNLLNESAILKSSTSHPLTKYLKM